ncbi:hypothetical protein HBI55_030390 [Parastagonospora nodorum]|nr:hypothetical protein HBI55_030390 [Parastagonospora nodorum]
MGAVEDAIDAAADFVGPLIDRKGHKLEAGNTFEAKTLVPQALSHLHAINAADLAADPDAPYDASLAGIVYGLLDVIILFGVLPHLSPGVSFSQRPRSVLAATCAVAHEKDVNQLSKAIWGLLPILEQEGLGVQPLLSQRILPDIISAIVELAFSPSLRKHHLDFGDIYQKVIERTPTSRLLPILTTFLQQPLPIWAKPALSRELALVPLRRRGIRHTIEFLSLSYLSKNSRIPQDASGSMSQIPIPIEAVRQASRLLVLPPSGIEQDEWLRQLVSQFWALLDGDEGADMSRAAGQIIAEGILSKRATGAPDSVGWQLFAQPILAEISPGSSKHDPLKKTHHGRVLVQEHDLEIALKRLSTIALACSHAGLLKRLVGPLLLNVWTLLNHANERSALDKKWSMLSRSILLRFMAISCDAVYIDKIATNIFWDGDTNWTYEPGSNGGIEIRLRSDNNHGTTEMDSILMRLGGLDGRIGVLVDLIADAKMPDATAGSIFLQATKRWLTPPPQLPATSLTDDLDTDPFAALADAKLSEAMGKRFRDQLARSPQHIMELMGQVLTNFMVEHQTKVRTLAKQGKVSRANMQNLIKTTMKDDRGKKISGDDTMEEELVAFAMSILSTLIGSAGFAQTPQTQSILASIITPLVYVSQHQAERSMSPHIINAANQLLQLVQPSSIALQTEDDDPLGSHRATLRAVLTDINSPEPPNRTWALNTLRKLIGDPVAFPVVDIPSMAHFLLSASVADPESYVHISAMPVLVDLAVRAPNPVVGIVVDAFVDIDEKSLELRRGKQTEEKERETQEALDYRLRIGEVLSNFVLDDTFFDSPDDTFMRYRCIKQICEACLSLSSRRGKRTQTLQTRTQIAQAENETQTEAEAAWGGPIPNLLDPEGENSEDQADRDALIKIVKGWEDTGIEEDVRIRASALSVLSTILEHRITFLRQATADAALQMVLLIITMETSETKAILRRAAIMVVMGLLRGLDGKLEADQEAEIGFDMTQQSEVERVLEWVREEDADSLVRDHAASVLEGLETWRMKKLYQVRDQGLGLGGNLNLEGPLRGLTVQPGLGTERDERRKLIVEELE